MLRGVFILLLGVICLGGNAQERMNAVLIVLDDMNDYIGVMGGHPQAKTPNIDQLANEGVFFSNAHANAPICAPSRASFLSGLYPSTTGNFGFAHIADNEVLSNSKFIMEYAAENGYETYSTGKIFHRSGDDPSKVKGEKQDQGPYAWDGTNPIPHPSVPEPFRNVGLLNGSFAPLSDVPPGGWRNDYNGSTPFRYVSSSDRDKMCDEISADFVMQWIEQHETLKAQGNDKPFFMAYGGMKPHTPHVVPQRFFDMYPLDKVMIPEILKNDLKDTYGQHFSIGGFNDFDSLLVSYATAEEGLRRYVQSKLACITFADSLVGVVHNAIKNSSFADNTVIILCGDNGFHMGEKCRLAKNTLWEESTRIPFMVKAPGFSASEGAIVSHPVGLIDIYPTFKDLCAWTGETQKNAQGAELDGHSLRAFLENPNTASWEGPEVALESVVNPASSEIAKQNYAVRSKDYRYILYPSGDEELYDLSVDKNEWNNVIFDETYAAIAQELREQLKALVPEVSFEKTSSIAYLFYDDFESYKEGDDLLTEGYKQKNGEATTTTLRLEDDNQYALNVSVNGSVISMRRNMKGLTPDKLYFFEASTRAETTVTAGSWEALTPNTITGHKCADWQTFSVPLKPNKDSWAKGEAMNLFIASAQNKPLAVDSFSFYAADLKITAQGFNENELIAGNDYQFEAIATPAREACIWSVIEGSGSATINTNGLLNAISEGSVQVVTTMENYPSVNCTTDVFIWDEAVTSILTISDIKEALMVDVPTQLTATLNPEVDIPVLWSVDDESKAIISQTTGLLIPIDYGTITITASLYKHQDVFTTVQLDINENTSVEDLKASYFKIYPNPSNGTFYIDGDGIEPCYKVYDSMGRLIKDTKGPLLNLQGYTKGIYYLVIDKDNVEKIVLK
ncbi:sulfatase-like hydrolase/transferase [Carboxylicivirga sediminis]|uniref:Sulfatase-like hydrolase/transferase n=1 Tax=Carboxylicivirga sediminis TaxID=2006564 RepID=A0A941F3M3_9BACT|nr:sulfatase-like hydrolase/transferase [Carboxylicivirga sediminis]MBR8536166.1 sulfatase-like hydrolase/transferase [Carboxylicivirga sediminis]